MGSEEPVTNSTHQALSWLQWDAVDAPSRSTPALRGWVGGEQSLATRSVVMFGLGAVGGAAFEVLARLGVGELLGVDPAKYGNLRGPPSPCRQRMSVGPRHWCRVSSRHAANPQVRMRTAIGLAQALPLRLLRRADLLVSAGDNLELIVWAGVRAAALGKPLLQGAVHGETWTVIVRAFDMREPNSACPACIMGQRDWSGLHSRAGCDPTSASTPRVEPTRTLPTVCGTAGHLVAGEALKWLSGLDELALHGQELTFCLRTYRVWRTELPAQGNLPLPARALAYRRPGTRTRRDDTWHAGSACWVADP